jgi:hypothetical protein
MSGWTGPHTFNQGPWRQCMRCEVKTKIAAMEWQRGLLLCPQCYDPYPLEGQREQAIYQVLTDGKVDFDIAEKLKNPVTDTDDMLIF